jgi:hypothetical protein
VALDVLDEVLEQLLAIPAAAASREKDLNRVRQGLRRLWAELSSDAVVDRFDRSDPTQSPSLALRTAAVSHNPWLRVAHMALRLSDARRAAAADQSFVGMIRHWASRTGDEPVRTQLRYLTDAWHARRLNPGALRAELSDLPEAAACELAWRAMDANRDGNAETVLAWAQERVLRNGAWPREQVQAAAAPSGDDWVASPPVSAVDVLIASFPAEAIETMDAACEKYRESAAAFALIFHDAAGLQMQDSSQLQARAMATLERAIDLDPDTFPLPR